tara:strand:+ start:217 stop:426 length:210 start_codon:yes stop_codon:yes gene_type:complete
MKRCRLKRLNFQIKTKMSKENKTSDKEQNGNDFIADVSSMLVANGIPAFGTKEFNDMCSNFFGGKPKSN